MSICHTAVTGLDVQCYLWASVTPQSLALMSNVTCEHLSHRSHWPWCPMSSSHTQCYSKQSATKLVQAAICVLHFWISGLSHRLKQTWYPQVKATYSCLQKFCSTLLGVALGECSVAMHTHTQHIHVLTLHNTQACSNPSWELWCESILVFRAGQHICDLHGTTSLESQCLLLILSRCSVCMRSRWERTVNSGVTI